MAEYYARNTYERKLDDQVRSTIQETGDKARMAEFVQRQSILNLLRRVDEKLKGYPVQDGYRGWVDEDKEYRLFASEADYKDFVADVDL